MEYRDALTVQLTELLHEIIINNKEIIRGGKFKNLISLCERDITILALISNNRNLTARSISIMLDVPKTTVVTAVARLEARGFLVRRQNADDRREMFLIPTAKGKQANREHEEYEQKFVDYLISRWSETDQKNLLTLLKARIQP